VDAGLGGSRQQRSCGDDGARLHEGRVAKNKGKMRKAEEALGKINDQTDARSQVGWRLWDVLWAEELGGRWSVGVLERERVARGTTCTCDREGRDGVRWEGPCGGGDG